MVKKGKDRSAKSSAKYDPKVTMYRLKSLQNMAHRDFSSVALQHQLVDENLAEWLTEANLKYGQRGSLYDLVRKVAWNWLIMSDETKAVIHALWIAKGLPESLWLKIENKYYEITGQNVTYRSKSIMVTFEADLFPYPDQELNPQQRDYVLFSEVLPLPVEDFAQHSTEEYGQHYWRQKTVKYGNVDYLYFWEQKMTDKIALVSATIETVEPLLYEKTLQIFAHITDPYPSPFDKTPEIDATYSTLLTDFIVAGSPPSPFTSNMTKLQAGESETKNIAVSFETELT